jgi:hypothetical protein
MATPAPSKSPYGQDVFISNEFKEILALKDNPWNKFITGMMSPYLAREQFLVELKATLRGKEAEVELLKKMKELVEKSLEVPAPAQ